MMTKSEFIETIKKSGANIDNIEEDIGNFETLIDVAAQARAQMPGIGFLSVQRRLSCFLSVCRHLDVLMERENISIGQTQLVIGILRLKDSTFSKAVGMFDIRGPRFRAAERARLPRTAQEYLAGLMYFGA